MPVLTIDCTDATSESRLSDIQALLSLVTSS